MLLGTLSTARITYRQSYLPCRRLHGHGLIGPIDLPATYLANATVTKGSQKISMHLLLLSSSQAKPATDRQAGLAPCATLPVPNDQSAAERRAALQQDLCRQCSRNGGLP